MGNIIQSVDEADALSLTRDARVVAIRWDLVAWGLVLDLDAPLSEAEGAPVRRAWLLFSGVSDVTWPMMDARLPTGCWLDSAIVAQRRDTDTEYTFAALLPVFDDKDSVSESPTRAVVIRAQKLTAVMSAQTTPPGEFGPAWEARTALASDAELLRALLQ